MINRGSLHDPQHKFGEIEAPGANISKIIEPIEKQSMKADPVTIITHNATCDLCNSTIVGIRHKC